MILLGYGDHRTRQPSGAMVPSKKWLDKGLQLVYIGNKVVWSILDGPHALTTASGGPKTTPCNLGIATGFGSTSGSGTTDRQTGPLLRRAASGWRSVVLFINPNSAGPSGAARLYQGIGTGGYDYGEACYFNTINALNFYQCVENGTTPLRVSTTNVTYGVWQSYGVTFDLRALGVTPDMYKNGAVITPSVNSTPSSAYGTVAYKIEFGNRDDNTRSWDGLIGPILIFDGYLTAQEHFDLDRNPWQIFDEDESFLWLPFDAGGAAALAGNAAAQAAASGTLNMQVPLIGAATTVATASGALTTTVPLSGQASVTAAANGALSVTFALSGAALANALAAGAISTSVALSGSALANALATGNLLAGGAGALAGNAAAQASASGSLSTAIPLQGAASALAVATGGLTTAFPLVGVAAAVSHVTGDLTVTFGGALSGNAVAQVLAAGALSIQVALSGSAVAHALATGILGSGDVPNTPQDTWDRALQALFEPFYGDFGEPAVVAGIPVVGMFSSRAQDSFGIVQPSAAVLRMSATHVAAVGDTVTVGARTYQIAAIHDLDGSGTEKTLELK